MYVLTVVFFGGLDVELLHRVSMRAAVVARSGALRELPWRRVMGSVPFCDCSQVGMAPSNVNPG